jgi:hypothetical protein
MVLALTMLSGLALAAPMAPVGVLAADQPDTIRTNLMVAEALLGDALAAITAELPASGATVVLVPGSTEAAANLLTTVATHHLLAAGHVVHLDQPTVGTDGPVYELRYRVDRLDLSYPDSGRRFLLWSAWVDRKVDLVVQLTLVDAADGQVITSQRLVRRFQDRLEVDQVAAVEAPLYPFTTAAVEGGGWTRRLEEIVVLGTLAGLVAVYFANTD